MGFGCGLKIQCNVTHIVTGFHCI